MANYNRVILVGNLTRDPKLSYTANNTPVCDFGLAINRKWRGQDETQREETCFVDCTIFGKQAETFNQYMSKGRPVLVEGRLQCQQWQAQDGSRRSKHVVIADRFQFLGGRGAEAAEPAASAPAPDAEPDYTAPEPPASSGSEDDIPF